MPEFEASTLLDALTGRQVPTCGSCGAQCEVCSRRVRHRVQRTVQGMRHRSAQDAESAPDPLDVELRDRFVAGASARALAAEYGLSDVRVRQRIDRLDPYAVEDRRERLRVLRREQARLEAQQRGQGYEPHPCRTCGATTTNKTYCSRMCRERRGSASWR